jgi:hypothetical protein
VTGLLRRILPHRTRLTRRTGMCRLLYHPAAARRRCPRRDRMGCRQPVPAPGRGRPGRRGRAGVVVDTPTPDPRDRLRGRCVLVPEFMIGR